MGEQKANRAGGCLCGGIRYEMHGDPLIVHACHCTLCQRRTGSAFAVNAWIESDKVVLLEGEPEMHQAPGVIPDAPSSSWFCPECGTCVWSHFKAAPETSRFVRVGTLDEPSAFTPDVHIFTRWKLPWVVIPDGVPTFAEFYNLKETWPDASRKRLRKLMGG